LLHCLNSLTDRLLAKRRSITPSSLRA
jgi:hypothetical protein